MDYGVKTIYADAWSAPWIHENQRVRGHRRACPIVSTVFQLGYSSGDWRQAYANFLVKYVQLYAAAGLPITHLGFLNEPDYEVSYSQMQISNNAAEAIDFIRVLAATVKAAGRTTKVLASQPLGLHPTIKPGLKRANDAWLLAHVL
jgi:O-glycosyl hydrolase